MNAPSQPARRLEQIHHLEQWFKPNRVSDASVNNEKLRRAVWVRGGRGTSLVDLDCRTTAHVAPLCVSDKDVVVDLNQVNLQLLFRVEESVPAREQLELDVGSVVVVQLDHAVSRRAAPALFMELPSDP